MSSQFTYSLSTNMAWLWYLSEHFLSSANISLSIYKNEKITRTAHLLKSNSTYFSCKVTFSMMDIKNFRWFFDRVPILLHQCNNTNITYEQFYSCLHWYFTHYYCHVTMSFSPPPPLKIALWILKLKLFKQFLT